MSLYYEASQFLVSSAEDAALRAVSLKSRIFSAACLKNKPIHIYALATEATKWSGVLSAIVETSELLSAGRKLTPALALLLVHDLLLSKNGIAAPKNHVLRQKVEKHKANLNAAFTRARLKARATSVEDWRLLIEAEAVVGTDIAERNGNESETARQPRWIRLNLLHTQSGDDIERDVFNGWIHVEKLSEILDPLPGASNKRYHRDQHIPNLVAAPPGTDLTSTNAYKTGRIILQDKASCFPATLLNPQHDAGDVIDACAAPGNKTSHLTALLAPSIANRSLTIRGDEHQQPIIFAIERDALRSNTLKKMLTKAGCLDTKKCPINVQIIANQDFLALDPQDARFANVRSILLDPSCSGSGIIGRDDGDDASTAAPPGKQYRLVLPRPPHEIKIDSASNSMSGSERKKRKRNTGSATQSPTSNKQPLSPNVSISTAYAEPPQKPQPQPAPPTADLSTQAQSERLRKLSIFQHKLLLHAFRFPAATRIVYSTCSIHAEENEHVIVRALASNLNAEGKAAGGWRILTRDEQVPGMRGWGGRGDAGAVRAMHCGDVCSEEVADACIRCSKGDGEGTMGFFVAGFVRDGTSESAQPGPLGGRCRDEARHEHKGASMHIDTGDQSSGGSWDGFED